VGGWRSTPFSAAACQGKAEGDFGVIDLASQLAKLSGAGADEGRNGHAQRRSTGCQWRSIILEIFYWR